MRLTPDCYGLNTNGHGGECCGITHLSTFPITTGKKLSHNDKVEFLKLAIVSALQKNQDEYNSCWEEHGSDIEIHRHAIEAVLIPEQLDVWVPAMEEVGFREVFSFQNSNSSNRCHVFFMETNV